MIYCLLIVYYFSDYLADIILGKSEFLEKLPGGAAVAESVLNAYARHLNGALAACYLAHSVG